MFKKRLLILFLSLIILPLNTLAYSKYLVPGGNNLGIHIKSNGILVVGFYDINTKKSDLQIGDRIVSINNQDVSSIDDMINTFDDNKNITSLKIGYLRNNELNYTTLNLVKDNSGVFKTGLYVKDSVTGIGTLTFIDPNTNQYGALGHEMLHWRSALKKREI